MPDHYTPRPFGRTYLLLLLIGIVVAFGLYAGFAFLQGVPPIGGPFDQQVSAARIELLKVSLASTAGIAAVAGLYVAYRKQRNEEAGTLREQDKVFTERFTSASQLLQSESAAVRLAGLNALARLADDSARDRDTCLRTVCAYLRLPMAVPRIAEPAGPGEPDGERAVDVRMLGERWAWPDPHEWEVRRSALTLITDRLQPGTRYGFWERAAVDLRDAVLIDFDMSNCVVDGSLSMSGAMICSSRVALNWENVSASGNIECNGADFTCGLSVEDSVLNGENFFFAARFRRDVYLRSVEFGYHLSLSSARLDGKLTLGACRLFGYATFAGCTARNGIRFIGCDLPVANPLPGRLGGPETSGDPFVNLSVAQIEEGLTFQNCAMPPIVRLSGSTLSGPLVLAGCAVDLRSTDLGGLDPAEDSFRPSSVLLDDATVAPEHIRAVADRTPFPYRTPVTPSDGYRKRDTSPVARTDGTGPPESTAPPPHAGPA